MVSSEQRSVRSEVKHSSSTPAIDGEAEPWPWHGLGCRLPQNAWHFRISIISSVVHKIEVTYDVFIKFIVQDLIVRKTMSRFFCKVHIILIT